MRMEAAGQHRLLAPRDAVGHQHRFGRAAGAVIHRGVGDIHAGDHRHLGLELEEILQRALADLRLVGRVGGQELAALDQAVDRGRHVMAIGAGAEEARHRSSRDIARGQTRQGPFDLQLALMRRQVEGLVAPGRLGHIGEERIDRLDADRGQHVGPLGLGQGQIAHYCCSATILSYAAWSSRSPSSAASAMVILKNQPASAASSLTSAGFSVSPSLRAVTVPETGA